MKEFWKKIFKIFGIGLGVYILLIASLYMFPFSSKRIINVVHPSYILTLNPIDHLVLSTPIEDEPEYVNEEEQGFQDALSTDRFYYINGCSFEYLSNCYISGPEKYKFKYDEGFRRSIAYAFKNFSSGF